MLAEPLDTDTLKNRTRPVRDKLDIVVRHREIKYPKTR
jgi:hypothetical protein